MKGLLRSESQLLFSFILPSDQLKSFASVYFSAIAVFLSVPGFTRRAMPRIYRQLQATELITAVSRFTISNTEVYLASKEGYWKGDHLSTFTSTASPMQLTDVA